MKLTQNNYKWIQALLQMELVKIFIEKKSGFGNHSL